MSNYTHIRVDAEVHGLLSDIKSLDDKFRSNCDVVRQLLATSPYKKLDDEEVDAKRPRRKRPDDQNGGPKKRKLSVKKSGIETWDEMTTNEEIFNYMTGITIEQATWFLKQLERAVRFFVFFPLHSF